MGKNVDSLLILITAICNAMNAASCCGVSTPFRKAFPMCLTDFFKFIFPSSFLTSFLHDGTDSLLCFGNIC